MNHLSFFKRYKKETTIVVLAIFVQLIAHFFFLTYFSSPDEFVVMTGDASAYRTATLNIIEHGVFSLSPVEPFVPDSFRSPGYSFFLLPLIHLTGDWQIVLLIQLILYSFIPLLLYLLTKNINEKVAYISSIIFVFEPTRLFLSSSLLTDSLFTLLFFLFLLFLLKIPENTGKKMAVLSGFFLGLATLVRPIAMFLPLFATIFLLVVLGFKEYKRVIISSLIIILTFLAVISPWLIRNKRLFDSATLSSVGSYNLIYYNIPEFLRYRDGEIKDQRLLGLHEDNKDLEFLEVLSLSRSDVHATLAKTILLEDFWGYAKFHLIKTVPFFVTDGLREITRTLGVEDTKPINFSTLITKGNFSEIKNYLTSGSAGPLLFLVGFAFWSIVTLLGLVVILLLGKFKGVYRYQIILLGATIFYFAFLTGPVSNARYRLPVSGLMIFMAVLAIHSFKKYVLEK